MRVGSLFSGIGGLDLGLERAGMNVVWQSEIDEYASAVLRKHWPGVPNLGDIRGIVADVQNPERGGCLHHRDEEQGCAGDERESRAGGGARVCGSPCDLICGGFPCQPFSVAGKRGGKEDDRYLWPEMLRVIKEFQPRWVLGENVPGLINMALDEVLSDLESLGYETGTVVVPACALDAPHRRDRVWILANARIGRRGGASEGQGKQSGGTQIVGSGDVADGPGSRWDGATRGGKHLFGPPPQAARSCDGGSLANAERTRLAERLGDETPEQPCSQCAGGGVQPIRGQVLPNDGCRRSEGAGRECESGRDAAYCWNAEPNVGRVAHGVPSRVDRLKCLGNGVVPQVAEAIGRMILEADRVT